ncbi:MAG: hypothetical protein ACLQVI_11965 [Polyangiaceae bacterium]
MTNMWQRRRSVLAVMAAAALGAVVASFNACSLDSNGLAPFGTDAGVDSSVVVDATIDTAPPDSSPPPDAAADADAGRDAACAPIETNCLDGIDNDCNGLTDCADPACTAGYTCVPAATPDGGFTGFAIYEPTQTTACPASYPTQTNTYEDLIVLPATCSACTCTAEGASCGDSTLVCTTSAPPGCGPDGGVSAVVGPACSPYDAGAPFGPTTSCTLSVPPATAGSCTAGGGAATLPSVNFGELSRVCAATEGPGAGCSAGSVCVAKPPAGFHGACVFVATSGTAECPAGYGSAHVTMPSATSFTDTRGCTSCGCGGASGASCSGAASLYSGPGCGGPAGTPVVVPADGACHGGLFAPPESVSSVTLDAGVVSEGACTPSGGQAKGSVTPEDQTVYCCQN